jgi:acyl-CoA ligase (AMP-forming) (exosortase A-associated)
MYTQLHDLVARAAGERAGSAALTHRSTTLTYDELWQGVRRVAGGLRRLGLPRGGRVAVYLDKRIETVQAIFGTSAADGVFVPVNPLLRARQVGYILADCEVQVLVTTAARARLLGDELAASKSVEHLVLLDGDGADLPGTPRCTPWHEFAAGHRPPAGADLPGSGPTDLDAAAILYTSGSTGKPKGVVLSHRNLIAGAESVSQYLLNTADDVILAVLPLSFDAGFSQLSTAFRVGAHVVLMDYLLPADVVRLCAKHRVTGLTCVPPLWIQLAEQSWPPAATERLRYFANTGGRMPRATLDKLRATFPAASPFLMYGLTEAFRSTYLDPVEVDRRPDSIGKAIPNAEILVVRPDGSLCDPGEEGELVHRGALVALGYWNDPERTAERFRPVPARDPALCTPEIAVWSGDIVVRDEDGFLYFVSRADEMIKTSGYRVSPTEIEEVVYDTGLVGEAVAVGVTDSRLGEHIAVVVSPPDGRPVDAKALRDELKAQLPLYMVPKEILVRAEIPRSPNGKFDRNLLRRELSR